MAHAGSRTGLPPMRPDGLTRVPLPPPATRSCSVPSTAEQGLCARSLHAGHFYPSTCHRRQGHISDGELGTHSQAGRANPDARAPEAESGECSFS